MHHLHCLRRVTSLAEAHEAIVVHGIFAVSTLDQGRGDLTVSSEQVLKRVLISATRESLNKNVVKGLKTKKSRRASTLFGFWDLFGRTNLGLRRLFLLVSEHFQFLALKLHSVGSFDGRSGILLIFELHVSKTARSVISVALKLALDDRTVL